MPGASPYDERCCEGPAGQVGKVGRLTCHYLVVDHCCGDATPWSKSAFARRPCWLGLVSNLSFRNSTEAETGILRYIEHLSNRRRRQSSLGHLRPGARADLWRSWIQVELVADGEQVSGKRIGGCGGWLR